MRSSLLFTLTLGLAAFGSAEPINTAQQILTRPDSVKEIMLRVADYQERDFGGQIRTDWKAGTYYSGLYAAYQATGDEDFRRQAIAWCENADWELSENHFFADDICAAQTFLDVYLDEKDPEMIADTVAALEPYFTQETIRREQLGHAVWRDESRPFTGRNVWWWCDSLYMAPPVLTRLYSATGDQRYLDLLNDFYWDTVDFLYKEDDGLFARDETYFDKKTPNGNPVYWSRGNGWVYAGLIRLLDHLPEDDPHRQDYIDLFVEMTRALVDLQQEDGLWRPALNDPDWKPSKESSGTSFFTYGLLGGINRGFLDKQAYLPVALKAWEGLVGCINTDGRLGYAQLVAGGPAHVRPSDSIDYAHGAFLLAASELYKMDLDNQDFAALEDPYEIKTLARDGVWTWFNDERVLYDGAGLYIGSIDSEGVSRIDYYSTILTQSPFAYQPMPLSSWKSKDDHNNPAIIELETGDLLAAYSKHHLEPVWYTRHGKKKGPDNWRTVEWSEEQAIEAPAYTTYNNLVQLSEENGRVFNFMRVIGWNPTLVLSEDNGKTWSEPIELVRSGNDRTRPYVKYSNNGQDRIDLIFTDAHPRKDHENNVYHMYYQDGAFHKSDGSLIRTLEDIKEQPLVPSEATLIYDGTEAGRGWVWDLEYDENGHPVVAFINSVDNEIGNDLRYRIARWDDASKKWTQRQIAYAGTHLYDREEHYAGGIAIDPQNTDQIYLSTDVDPATGKPNATGRYQMFRGTYQDGSWTFQQLTHDAQVDNIRPIVPRDHDFDKIALWVRGRYTTYEDYDTAIVGILEKSDSD
ncbi:glycoside hydrolase family 88 protein [Pelagicoccus sp. SDUM812003]|uniref:glycoside hydrolase family 88 protein n=1 Tax=Pelagicoccus sp. SDUM812003 TaxID=3041267 RepID=UPI00280FC1D4|nr:glycoside hydrolase family 88 protein [Pelagicoccus sp. SDUM812003]MDQ8205036.1 glycoside hydrolase family 88 protein [Pelagicoccus sp. SDUM812003]